MYKFVDRMLWPVPVLPRSPSRAARSRSFRLVMGLPEADETRAPPPSSSRRRRWRPEPHRQSVVRHLGLPLEIDQVRVDHHFQEREQH